MMKAMNKIKYFVVLALSLGFMQLSLQSCSDEPSSDNYYTFTGEMASDYLQNRSDLSEFRSILDKASEAGFRPLDLLATYGSYTVFAPTNEAVDRYLSSKGCTSVDQLSAEDCDTLARTHIIKQEFYTTDFSEGTLPTANMLDRYLKLSFNEDTINGQPTISFYVNTNSMIVQKDDSVENGVVHILDEVIGSTGGMLPELLKNDSTISIFYSALTLTHMNDSLQKHIDPNYTIGLDSVITGKRYHTAAEYEWGYWLARRQFKYTAFVEKDEVYARYGISDINGLIDYAKQIYDEAYPEDAGLYDDDYTDRRNPLNRFVSYHLLDRQATYNELTVNDLMLNNNFVRRIWDVADWYETMLPFSVMKVSYPSGRDAGRYINRRGVQSHADSYGQFLPGCKITAPSESDGNQNADNGVYHYIEDILTYSKETQEVALGERMRFDATLLSPDFMCGGTDNGQSARGRYAKNGAAGGPNNGQYSNGSEANTQCTVFKPGFCRNWQYTNATFVSVRNRHLNYWSYQGDEIILKGRYDFTIQLPPVPEGTYELRWKATIDFQSRGIIQVYLDDKPCGIPIDMRMAGTDPTIGWLSDNSFSDTEAINAFDKAFHNRGWMKGSDAAGDSDVNGGGGGPNIERDHANEIRRVVTQFYTSGKENHYMRIKQVLDSEDAEFAFDFIELCPRSIYDNELYLEDKH